jgi:hypothetical protein
MKEAMTIRQAEKKGQCMGGAEKHMTTEFAAFIVFLG